ncbi:MAG TPA: M2 family metallopeptidase [Steroidobacteraceae bacterium]|jgi:peptidyl-dipeptidase A|nr:M2 family metallopeptidase [Steroidobacteraceae bacterium]
MSRTLRRAVVCALMLSVLPASLAQAETADEFVARTNRELAELAIEGNAAGWTQATYINVDTQLINAKATERFLEYLSKAVEEAKQFEGQPMSPASKRTLALLKFSVSAPAPADPAKRAEFSKLLAAMEAKYGSGKYCPQGPESCRDETKLKAVLESSRNYDELLDAWTGWHSTARPLRADYARYVELANDGARGFGFEDLGAMWRSNYDMSAEEFKREAARLYGQVQPLYKELHCYTRGKLAAKYGADKVPAGKPIPAHLLGNMWAQQWDAVYDLLEPYPGVSSLDVDAALEKQSYDAVKMTKSAESFYRSIAFPALPQTFWERSMLTQPRDRDVQCHASAWHMDGKEDVRIKQCIRPTYEELRTIYHELGHVYYFLWYKDQPYLFQNGAHEGFHEAIGDTVNLSMTPAYLAQIGLVSEAGTSREAVINQQMKMALEKIAFLPFGKLIDEWRWKVFSGEVTPENYNAAWWALREQYQGVAAPVARTEADFDPGAKYHVPGNVSYTRYFLSFIIQFQFHKALCEAAGFKGPLSECSIYGNEVAGRKFGAMLAKGASAPWQDALFELTGTREMDASAILDYFAPLQTWLKEQNKGQKCGW